MKRLLAVLALVAGFTGSAHATTLSEDVVSQLGAMKSIYAARYAPVGWKKQFAGYDLGAEYNKAVTA
ncbi:MAG: hypothetical protein EOP05_06045, partial [Proteobacteria bacterium]